VAKKKGFKRGFLGGDMHCGHRVGLTPPQWQRPEYSLSDRPDAKYYKAAIALWAEFDIKIRELQPFDFAVFNGDCIDGKGTRSGGTELITTDRNEQCKMAETAIRHVDAEKVLITRGTGYHTGMDDDWEDQIAYSTGAEISDHQWVEVNGCVLDCKHAIGASSIPHGRFTPLAKDRLWNVIWHTDEGDPKSDIIIRSHVHYHAFCGDNNYLAMTLPALQGKGSKFGKRICTGTVHWGFCWIDIYDDGRYYWNRHIIQVEEQNATLLKG
jgi:hypothetical protein